MENNKRVLITGANGLLGRHVVDSLSKENYHIHSLVRAEPSRTVEGVNYHLCDLSSDWSVKELPKRVDAIIHLAQSPKFRDFPEHALDVFRVNIESTARLLNHASQTAVKQFIYASSGGIYGSGQTALSENAPIIPHGQLGYYLGSKFCSEVLIQSYAAHMQITVLRFFFVYGPGQKRSMLIPRLVDNIKRGRPVTLQGNQGIRINPIHVADATRAAIQALNLERSATFNVGGPDVLSLRKIGEIIGEKLGVLPKFDTIRGAPHDLIGDISAMRELLCDPRIRFRNGIADIL